MPVLCRRMKKTRKDSLPRRASSCSCESLFLLCSVNDRDAEIVDLKNKLAALETERLQGEMD